MAEQWQAERDWEPTMRLRYCNFQLQQCWTRVRVEHKEQRRYQYVDEEWRPIPRDRTCVALEASSNLPNLKQEY